MTQSPTEKASPESSKMAEKHPASELAVLAEGQDCRAQARVPWGHRKGMDSASYRAWNPVCAGARGIAGQAVQRQDPYHMWRGSEGLGAQTELKR